MSTNPYYGQKATAPTRRSRIGNLELEEGGHISGLSASVATQRNAERGEGQRDPRYDLVLGNEARSWSRSTSATACARSGEVFYHRRQPDRKWPFHLTEQQRWSAGRTDLSRKCALATTFALNTSF